MGGFPVEGFVPFGHWAGYLLAFFLPRSRETNGHPVVLLSACLAPCWASVPGLGWRLPSTEAALFWVVPNSVDKIGCLLGLGELLHVNDRGLMRPTYFQSFVQHEGIILRKKLFL